MNEVRRPYLQPGGLGQFAIKACLVVGIISICTMFVANWIIDSAQFAVVRSVHVLRSEFQGVGSVGGAPFWKAVEYEIEQAASPQRDLPPEKRQKLLAELRVIATRWRPFIDALASDIPKADSCTK